MSRKSLPPAGILVFLALACGDDSVTPTPPPPPPPPPDVVVTKVELAASATTLTAIGASVNLTLTARDQNGAVVTGVTPTWSTSNASAVTVADGKATAVANGTAVITAKVGQASGQVSLIVQQEVASVTVTPSDWSPTALQTRQQFTAEAHDANNHVVPNTVISWYSDDEQTATISATGEATAVAIGNTVIGAVVASDTGTAAVKVTQVLATIEVTPTSWQPTAVGLEQQLTAVGNDANGQPLSDWMAEWQSSDTSVVSVSAAGLMRSMSQGNATVSISSSGKSSQVAVLVAQEVHDVKVNPDSAILYQIGDTLTLAAVATDQNGSPIPSVAFTWQTANPAVATVSANGLVTATAAGNAVITASGMGKSATAMIEVRAAAPPPIISVQIFPEQWTPGTLGERFTFAATVINADNHQVANAPLSWQSSDPSIATVDAEGQVTAIKAGSVTITVTSGGLHSSANVDVDPTGALSDGVVWTVFAPYIIESPAYISGGVLYTPATSKSGQPEWRILADDGVAAFQWEGTRIAVLRDVSGGVGTLVVRDRNTEWVTLGVANVRQFQLEGNRIGVLLSNGTVRIKTGIYGGWTNVADGVAKFQLEGNRIGLLGTDGSFRVRDGMSGNFTMLVNSQANALDFQLEGNRIGILQQGNQFRMKDGIQGPWWVLDAGTAASFQLEGNRIAVLKTNGELRAKDGPSGPWSVIATTNITKYQLDGNRIGVMRGNGDFFVTEGLDGAWWKFAEGNAVDFHLHKGRVARLLTGNRIHVKTGNLTAPWEDYNVGRTVTHLHAAVAVPMNPHRTRRDTYLAKLNECDNDAECSPTAYIPPPSVTLVPVPYYGFNCGAGRGTSNPNKIVDGMDYACWHHDGQKTEYWYNHISLVGDLPGACIVKYALDNARMTRNGVELHPGTEAYKVAWGNFPTTASAIYLYSAITSTCGANTMENFITETSLGL